MYSRGMSTQGIRETIEEIYNVDISPELVSRVTDEVKKLAESAPRAVLSGCFF
jgi:transposase-like protein